MRCSINDKFKFRGLVSSYCCHHSNFFFFRTLYFNTIHQKDERANPGNLQSSDDLFLSPICKCLSLVPFSPLYCFSLSFIFSPMPWLRRLLAGLSTRTPGFDLGSVDVRFCGGRSCTGTVFSPSSWGVPLSVSLPQYSLLMIL